MTRPEFLAQLESERVAGWRTVTPAGRMGQIPIVDHERMIARAGERAARQAVYFAGYRALYRDQLNAQKRRRDAA